MPATISVKVMALLLVPLAPLPYWVLGLPWCATGDQRRLSLSPLVGCALAGFYAELALILALPACATVTVLAVASAVFAWFSVRRGRRELRRAAREWIPLYLASVIASSVSPFPVLGSWAGDWYLLYQMGINVIQGHLPVEMLARPPLFGAATAPLWLFSDGLIPYQMMSAVATASAVTATLFFVDFFWPRAPRVLLLPLLLSPFFLHHAAAAWGKLLAAGLILAAIVEAREARLWSGALLFALSVAVHEGSIIWAPCVLAAHAAGQRGWRASARALLAMALSGVVIIAPLLVWIWGKYGLAAKIASNPTLTARDQVSFPIKTALVVVATFVGWAPITNAVRWLEDPQRLSRVLMVKESFRLVTSWFTTLAGTMLGLLFPFALCWQRLKNDVVLRRLMRAYVLAALGITLIANAVLCGYYSWEGSMQTGMVAMGLGAYGLFAGAVAAAGPAAAKDFRRMSVLMGIVGTLPWLATNLLFSTGLWLSAGFRARMQVSSESDYALIQADHLGTLGMVAYPEVPLMAALLLAAVLWRARPVTSPRAEHQVDPT